MSDPTQPVVLLDPKTAEHFSRLGQHFMTIEEASMLWNTAVRTQGQNAPLVVSTYAAGAVIEAVSAVVEAQVGPPPDPANPFAALPAWATALFERLGVIRPPAVEADAPPKPVESIGELRARAAKAGLHLA